MNGSFKKIHLCSSLSNTKPTVKQNESHASKFTFPTHQITDPYKVCNIFQSGSVLHALLSDWPKLSILVPPQGIRWLFWGYRPGASQNHNQLRMKCRELWWRSRQCWWLLSPTEAHTKRILWTPRSQIHAQAPSVHQDSHTICLKDVRYDSSSKHTLQYKRIQYMQQTKLVSLKQAQFLQFHSHFLIQIYSLFIKVKELGRVCREKH